MNQIPTAASRSLTLTAWNLSKEDGWDAQEEAATSSSATHLLRSPLIVVRSFARNGLTKL